MDNREYRLQLWQLIIAVATTAGSIGTIILIGALWVNSQMAVLADRVANQTQAIDKLSESNRELYKMWAEHEAHLQVLDEKIMNLGKHTNGP